MSQASMDVISHSSPPREHSVGLSESLASIAIRYDSTPSELAQLNKLSSHMVYPGQKLKVPSPDGLSGLIKKLPVSPSLPIKSNRVQFSSQFSSYENISISKSMGNETETFQTSLPRASPGDEVTDTLMRFRAKYITQTKGCVHGKLHLCPQSIIFEPDPNDQLVEDKGKDEFAVILSMQGIIDLTVTSDFTKFLMSPPRSLPRTIPIKSPLAKSKQYKEVVNSFPEDEIFGAPLDFEVTESAQESCTKHCIENIPDVVTDSTDGLPQPMFLRLTVLETPLDTFDTPAVSIFSRLIKHRTEQDVKRAKSRQEYWFAIPHSLSDALYAFLITWNSNLHRQDSGNQNTEPLDDTSYTLHFKDNYIADLPSSSWDVLPSLTTLREIDHRAQADAVPLPNLVGTASLLNQRLLRELNYLLPSRTVGHDMWLIYSSFVHGISLRTMYRNMETCNGPVVFILKDDQQGVFGGVISCPLRVSEHYYGTGESFMFRVESTSHKVSSYHWTGLNTFFVKGDHDSISFGGGDGKPALWLDGDFYNGSSFPCSTFDNLQLSGNEDFLCTGFESWGFVDWSS
ncbi:Nuclear receptor coactivator 7-like [Oopsacas minuta]|uniref:Oxidation resistance protein 1 n=1 Tax=Oopsacas minuta TaxID=111878 RepID=A0AAV7JWQ5_9METZ|nr:Nuclear receptor coactivator 7-like [Oopsacas minuta]